MDSSQRALLTNKKFFFKLVFAISAEKQKNIQMNREA